jgi:hypothetical protein
VSSLASLGSRGADHQGPRTSIPDVASPLAAQHGRARHHTAPEVARRRQSCGILIRSESLNNALESNMSQSSIRAGFVGRTDWPGPWGVAARGVARRASTATANQAECFDERLALTPACVSLTLTACRRSSRNSKARGPSTAFLTSTPTPPTLNSFTHSPTHPSTSPCKLQEPPSAPSGLSRPATFT